MMYDSMIVGVVWVKDKVVVKECVLIYTSGGEGFEGRGEGRKSLCLFGMTKKAFGA